MLNLKPIPTSYLGYHFRSRLEARWGVFFNSLKVRFLYEFEGYELDGYRYLPDFYLPELDCYVEIKGDKPKDIERLLAYLLCKYARKPVHIFSGPVPLPSIRDWSKDNFSIFTFLPNSNNGNTGSYSREIYAINECPVCKKVNFSPNGIIGKLPCKCTSSPSRTPSAKIYRGYTNARSAKFEFGNHGN